MKRAASSSSFGEPSGAVLGRRRVAPGGRMKWANQAWSSGARQARLWCAAERAAHQHAVDAITLAIVGHAIAREGEEHGEDGEALLAIEKRGDAALLRADRYDPEIEAFFGNVFLIN